MVAILESAGLEANLTDSHHQHALEYLSIHLSIRDRKEIVKVMCHSSPDHLTQAVRELVAAYEPVIRHVHNAVDLSETVGDLEAFLRDMIKLAKLQPGKDDKESIPTVADFIQLLRKHQSTTHKFMHQCCKNGKEVTGWYLEWAKTAASHFKRHVEPESRDKGAGDLTADLNELFSKLPKEKQESIIPILDAQTQFLDKMHKSSTERFAMVLKTQPARKALLSRMMTGALSRPSSRSSSPTPGNRQPNGPNETHPSSEPHGPPPTVSSDPGPGAYLARWQDLLERTPITPLTPSGKVKRASSAEVVQNSTADSQGNTLVEFAGKEARGEKIAVDGKKPDTGIVVQCLGEDFRKLLAEKSCYW